MELTKEQIQFIDKRLKKDGIRYWDVRIEMLDHIVSDMELHSKTNDFKTELNASLKRIGWSRNLSSVNRESWQNVNRKFRSEYHKGFVNFFRHFKNISVLVLCLFALFIISEVVSFKNFIKLNFLLFILPLLLVTVFFVKSLIKKHGRSVNLDYAFTYLLMSFFILNAFPTFFKNQSEFFQKVMWFIILPIHFIAFYSGYHLYKKTIVKIDKIKNQLLS